MVWVFFIRAKIFFFTFLYISFTLSHTIMWCAEAEWVLGFSLEVDV